MKAFCLACLLAFSTNAFASNPFIFTDNESGLQFVVPASQERTLDVRHHQSGFGMTLFLEEGEDEVGNQATVFAKLPFDALESEFITDVREKAMELIQNMGMIGSEEMEFTVYNEVCESLYKNENLSSQRIRTNCISDEEENSFIVDVHALWNDVYSFVILTIVEGSNVERLDKLSESIIGSIVFE